MDIEYKAIDIEEALSIFLIESYKHKDKSRLLQRMWFLKVKKNDFNHSGGKVTAMVRLDHLLKTAILCVYYGYAKSTKGLKALRIPIKETSYIKELMDCGIDIKNYHGGI